MLRVVGAHAATQGEAWPLLLRAQGRASGEAFHAVALITRAVRCQCVLVVVVCLTDSCPRLPFYYYYSTFFCSITRLIGPGASGDVRRDLRIEAVSPCVPSHITRAGDITHCHRHSLKHESLRRQCKTTCRRTYDHVCRYDAMISSTLVPSLSLCHGQ